MACLMSSGSRSQASITARRSGVIGSSEPVSLCSRCASVVLVMLPGCDCCKAFPVLSSTGITFVSSWDCPGCDSICPGFDGFCPDVKGDKMVEAAGIRPAVSGRLSLSARDVGGSRGGASVLRLRTPAVYPACTLRQSSPETFALTGHYEDLREDSEKSPRPKCQAALPASMAFKSLRPWSFT